MVAPIPRGESPEVVFASAAQLDGPAPALEDLLAAVAANRPAWHADALCREHPEVSWFAERGEPMGPAKDICARCLVLAECTAWALDQDQSLAGIWGGTTAPQRKRMREARARSTAA